jgi:hypothetical protein
VRRRELRERRARLESDQPPPVDETVAFEIEEGLDFESPTSWQIRLNDRSSAA